ncbi:acetylhydrolase [Glaciecola sp. MH2013]|uniref:alpha/beta hydrolase family protein n=1 Tax=Glaciecola sp. MH2013 TaxID=2785524 RepID=UPI00189F0BF5|nr:acetylhydrolase [Glaciecola sp. MH2013]MBF7074210.1 acetylhydrolase [Glaciecola sp. MH2013]
MLKTTSKARVLIGSLAAIGVLSLSACGGNEDATKRDASTQNTLKTESTTAQTEVSKTAQQLYPITHPDMQPELAAKGSFEVGVKTIDIINEKYIDLLTQQVKPRKLKLEIWYPADTPANASKTTYENETRLAKKFSIQADAVRDAVPLASDKNYPVVVISHGYTGYRTIMFYLGEHLASHGYIVAAIDHTDSTNEDVDMINGPFNGFPSTLINRSRDQQFTLDYITEQEHFLSAVVDKQNAGLIGYSMGAFGALNTIGACYNFSPEQAGAFTGVQIEAMLPAVQKALNSCAGGQYDNPVVDSKWKGAITFAIWGGQHDLFSDESLAEVQVPKLFVSGNLDDISGYDGIRSLFQKTKAPSTYLLTMINARHNIAPHPAPAEAWESETDFGHYYEPAWSSAVLNDINKHFTLAMMNCHVKSQADACDYLNLSASSDQVQVDGKLPEPWKGFDSRFSTGLRWEQK